MSDEKTNPEEVVEDPSSEPTEPAGEVLEGTQESPAAVDDDQKTDGEAAEVTGDPPEETPDIDGFDKYLSQFRKDDAPKDAPTAEPGTEKARIQDVIREREELRAENDRLRAGRPVDVEGLEDYPEEIQNVIGSLRDKLAQVETQMNEVRGYTSEKELEQRHAIEVSQAREIIGAERFDDRAVQGNIGRLIETVQNSNGSMTPLITLADAAEKTISGSEYRRGVADAEKRLRHLATSQTDGAASSAPKAPVNESFEELRARLERENPGFRGDL